MSVFARGRRFLKKIFMSVYRLWILFYRSFLTRNFKKSTISFPELIHPSSRVIGTFMQKNVIVGESTTIQDSVIRGEIQIGDHCGIDRMRISGNVKIGRRTALIGPSQIFSLINPVTIGSFCSIAGNITIQEYNHPVDRCSTAFMHRHVLQGATHQDVVLKGAISIGNDVWIGAHSVVISGAIISDGAVIGANSTVVGTIPPYAIAVGSPARVIRYRFSEEIIQALLGIEWWNWSDELIRANRELFDDPLTMEKIMKIRNSGN